MADNGSSGARGADEDLVERARGLVSTFDFLVDNFAESFDMPPEELAAIRSEMTSDTPVAGFDNVLNAIENMAWQVFKAHIQAKAPIPTRENTGMSEEDFRFYYGPFSAPPVSG